MNYAATMVVMQGVVSGDALPILRTDADAIETEHTKERKTIVAPYT